MDNSKKGTALRLVCLRRRTYPSKFQPRPDLVRGVEVLHRLALPPVPEAVKKSLDLTHQSLEGRLGSGVPHVDCGHQDHEFSARLSARLRLPTLHQIAVPSPEAPAQISEGLLSQGKQPLAHKCYHNLQS
jgi:hypothetical protein